MEALTPNPLPFRMGEGGSWAGMFHVEQIEQSATFGLACGQGWRQTGDGGVEMDGVLKLPIDLPQLPPFRQLKGVLGWERALGVWFVLWQELGYRCQEGGSPGRLLAGDVPGLKGALEIFEAAVPLTPDPSPRGEGNRVDEIFGELVKCRLLVADGEDWVCPRFALLHGEAHLARSQAQRGGDMKAYLARQKRAEGEVFKQSCLIPEARLVDGEGQPLEADLVKRLMRLIVACDNALFKGTRPHYLFTEGLIADALEVLRKYSEEEVDLVLRTVVKHRNHPALGGMSAEKLLPKFGEIVGRLDAA